MMEFLPLLVGLILLCFGDPDGKLIGLVLTGLTPFILLTKSGMIAYAIASLAFDSALLATLYKLL